MNEFPTGPLDPREQRRVLQLCGQLSRPALDESQLEALRETVSDDDWQPLPRIASLNLLEPLYRHHVAKAGADPERLFSTEDRVANPPDAAQLAQAWYRRKALLEELFTSFQEEGVKQVLTLKGVSTAPLYPSPALRQMCDADLMVSPDELPSARQALENLGWEEAEDRLGHVFRHDSGFMVDLKFPGSDLAKELYDNSVDHPGWDSPIVRMGQPAAQIIVHALQTADGMRLWRDVADIHLLLGLGDARELAKEALELAQQFECAVPLISIFRFMNEHSPAAARLPGRFPDSWSDEEERACRLQIQLYETLACEPLPPVAFNLLRLSIMPMGAMKSKLAGLFTARPRSTNSRPAWAERDPLLGTLPRAGTIQRQWLKARVVMRLFLSPAWGHYRHLMRLQRDVRNSPAAGSYNTGRRR